MVKQFICILFLLPNLVFAAEFTEGKEYQVITNPAPWNHSNKKPVVMEFFSFGCPWCYKIEPKLQDWLEQTGQAITLDKVPVVYHNGWDLYAKAFYIAKVLALSDKINPILFKAIQDEKRSLNRQQAMIDFLVKQGMDKEIINSAFNNSSTIDTYVTNGTSLMARYQITGIPTFVINNKYKTDLKMAGGPDHLIDVLNYLVKKSR